MSIKDSLTSFIDNSGLKDVFHRKPANKAQLRKPLLSGIAKAEQQFASGQVRGPGRWWTASNDVVALTVKVKGATLDINGQATNHVPAERFPEFLDRFRQAVEAGEFDGELANHSEGNARVAVPRAKRQSTISPEAAKERGRTAADSRARNRAAREANPVGS